MPANDFIRGASAKDATEALRMLVEFARREYGHRAYTASIAEKKTFRMEVPRRGEAPVACIKRCTEDNGHWSRDKCGPAACVDTGKCPKVPGNRVFVFFGWAPL
jgi:hypothetical protein